MVNLDLYRVFYAVAQKGSLTKAAEELYISQPAVSQSIKQLETQLGVTLFKRKHHGMELSEEGGKRIIGKVDRALRLLEEAEQEVIAVNNQEEIRLSGAEEIFRYILAEKVAEFSQTFPTIHIKFCPTKNENLCEALSAHHVDIAIAENPCICDDSIISYPTGIRLEEVCLVGKKYQSCAKKEKNINAIPKIALIGDEETLANVSGVDVETAKGLAIAGAGMIQIPKAFALREISDEKLFVLQTDISKQLPTKPLFVSMPKNSEKKKLVETFLSVLQLEHPL